MTREEEIRQAAEKLEIKVISNPWTLFERGAVWADQHPNWISVEERLPEEGDLVLAIREGAPSKSVDIWRYVGYNESTDTYDWEWYPYYRAIVDDITYWMPFPPTPKEGGEQ